MAAMWKMWNRAWVMCHNHPFVLPAPVPISGVGEQRGRDVLSPVPGSDPPHCPVSLLLGVPALAHHEGTGGVTEVHIHKDGSP